MKYNVWNTSPSLYPDDLRNLTALHITPHGLDFSNVGWLLVGHAEVEITWVETPVEPERLAKLARIKELEKELAECKNSI